MSSINTHRAQDWQVHNTDLQYSKPSLIQTPKIVIFVEILLCIHCPELPAAPLNGALFSRLPYSRMLTRRENLVSFLISAWHNHKSARTKVQQFTCCSTNYMFNTWHMTKIIRQLLPWIISKSLVFGLFSWYEVKHSLFCRGHCVFWDIFLAECPFLKCQQSCPCETLSFSFLVGALKLHNLLVTTAVCPLSQPKRKPMMRDFCSKNLVFS